MIQVRIIIENLIILIHPEDSPIILSEWRIYVLYGEIKLQES